MSRFDDAFEMHEGEPVLDINVRFNDKMIPLHMDYETTAVFTHSKPYEHYDHVFVELDSDDERTIGAFIWRQVLPDWEDLKKALDDRDFQHIHSPYPSPADVEQYETSNLQPPEPKVIVEAEDEDEVTRAMEKIDHELDWFLNDPHFYDKRKPRDD
jgi:hypothetical protein